MAREFGQLAHHWSGSYDAVHGWLMSRKYNGLSVLWDGGFTQGMLAEQVPWYYRGKTKEMLATGLWSFGRGNKPKVVMAPSYFLDALPKGIPVHGEIWFDDRLNLVNATVSFQQYTKPMWGNLKFLAFNSKPFKQWEDTEGLLPDHEVLPPNLAGVLKGLKRYQNDIFNVIETKEVKSEQDIIQMKTIAKKNGWEGIMFGNPDGEYECFRSYNNLKWKQEFETEAIIFGYTEGKRSNKGSCGSLNALLTWDDKVVSVAGGLPKFIGREVDFSISGLRKDERPWEVVKEKYPIGSKVKFKYNGVSEHGVPNSPNIYRGK